MDFRDFGGLFVFEDDVKSLKRDVCILFCSALHQDFL